MTQQNCLHFGGFFAFEAFSPPTFSVVLSFTYLDFFSQIKWKNWLRSVNRKQTPCCTQLALRALQCTPAMPKTTVCVWYSVCGCNCRRPWFPSLSLCPGSHHSHWRRQASSPPLQYNYMRVYHQ